MLQIFAICIEDQWNVTNMQEKVKNTLKFLS